MLEWIVQMDFAVLDFIQQHLRTPFGDWLMVLMSTLGNGGMLWIALSVILLCRRKTRRCGWLILLAMALGFLINDIFLKNLIERIRPCNMRPDLTLLLPQAPQTFSFMSGHTLSSFAAATVIFLHHKKWAIPAGITAALIAFSRLYLYVHFPTDVLAGMVFGIALATALVKGVDAWGRHRQRKQDVFSERNRP